MADSTKSTVVSALTNEEHQVCPDKPMTVIEQGTFKAHAVACFDYQLSA